MLNTVFLAKILAIHLQVVLPNLIVYEQISAVKDRTIQNKLHFVCSIIEQADSEAVLINPRHLIEVVMLPSFRLYFCSWIQLLCVISGVLMERSKTYTVLLHLSELSTFIFAVHSYI